MNILKTNNALLIYSKNYVGCFRYFRVLHYRFVDIYYRTSFATQKEDSNIYGTQKYLITTLSITEMSFLVIAAVRDYIILESDLSFHIGMLVSNYKTILLTGMYYFRMFGIVIDRLMQIL